MMSNTKRKCMYQVTIPSNQIKKIRKFVSKSREHGGNFHFNFHNPSKSVARMGDQSVGKYDEVDIAEAIISFHTHPDSCSPTICALGIPSDSDIVNAMRASLKGQEYHILFSKDGNYVIRTPEALQRRIKSASVFKKLSTKIRSAVGLLLSAYVDVRKTNQVQLRSLLKELANASSGRDKTFIRKITRDLGETWSYNKYKRLNLLVMIKLVGMSVKLYPKLKLPKFPITLHCSKSQTKDKFQSYTI